MHKNTKSAIEESPGSNELCATLVNHCYNIYKLLGNHFRKDFYLWTLLLELDNSGLNYQMCGNQSDLDLYPNTIKISCPSSESIFLVVFAKSDLGESEKSLATHTLLNPQTAHYLIVNFGHTEFKYSFV